ncbi:DUF4012 domain-containing protein [Microbacterium fluvii]|uniref:DUF4012 domain-containing protein n=1 Tax=Microbacterium fluvii TaxID=415215 RepID=A0ABW2HD10_9MICO|nr:DUF4012 domain-containing protein [Microbacterium fluvii]MCU4671945.1 DUF4012 domain-containing protein [Microbacterium fluvii]
MTPGAERDRTTGIALLLSGAMLVALIAGFAWAASRAWVAQRSVAALSTAVDDATTAARAGDSSGIATAVSQISDDARAAADAANDPTWGVLQALPLLGANFTAVRIVATQVDAISDAALVPLGELLAEPASPGDEAIDLDALAKAHVIVADAADALATAQHAMSGIEPDELLSPVADGVTRMQQVVTTAAPAAQQLAAVTDVLPAMLGADGEREILLMLQNNAELRTGGGATGSFVLLSADDGHLEITGQADSSRFPKESAALVSLPDSVAAMYGDDVARFVQNVSITSDFEVTGRLAAQWWKAHTGTAPDAVVSMDPLVLKSLLAATGPVTLDDGSKITAENLVKRLLIDPYTRADPAAQTAFQQHVTRAIFEQLLTEGIDPVVWGRALADPVAQGRVSVWSADPTAQSVFADTVLGGPSARHRLAGDDAYAVYLNDATGSKMDSLLDVSITAGAAQCRADGLAEVAVTVELTSTAPEDAATSLTKSMTGGGRFGTPAGLIATNVAVAAPAGSYFAGVRIDGDQALSADVDEAGFPTSMARVTLRPGESAAVEFRFVSAAAGAVDPQILHTPLISTPAVDLGATVACG